MAQYREPMKLSEDVLCWYGHSHVKVLNASDPCEWQRLPLAPIWMSQTTDFKLKAQYIHKHLPQHPPPRGKTANLKQLPYRDILQRLAITCSFLLQLCARTLPPHSSLLTPNAMTGQAAGVWVHIPPNLFFWMCVCVCPLFVPSLP